MSHLWEPYVIPDLDYNKSKVKHSDAEKLFIDDKSYILNLYLRTITFIYQFLYIKIFYKTYDRNYESLDAYDYFSCRHKNKIIDLKFFDTNIRTNLIGINPDYDKFIRNKYLIYKQNI